MSFIRKMLPAAATGAAGVGALFGGAPPDLAGIVAATAGQLVEGPVPTGRPLEEIVKDTPNRESRAQAYESFGSAVATMWLAAWFLSTYRPKPQGYVHGLALLVRSQRRFEEQTATATAALSSILLYGSTDTQGAAVALVRTLAEKLSELGRYPQGSPEAVKAFETASIDLGDKVVVWRKAAQADLGLSS